MTVFLRILLLNVLFAVGLGTVAYLYDGHVHIAGKLAIAAVLCVYSAASAYALYVAYVGGGDLAHIDHAINTCPVIGILGAVSGFLIASEGGVEGYQERFVGATSGLAASFTAIVCMIVLMQWRHLLRKYERGGCGCK